MRWMSILVVLMLISPVRAAAPAARTRSMEERAQAAALEEARKTAAKIDEILFTALERAKVKPAALSEDAAFLRRASLDISGKIPVVSEVRKFLRDASPEKRAEAIERLLESPGYVNHFTTMWMDLILPEAKADFQKRFLMMGMHQWLRKHFAANTPYDRMVHELLSLPMQNHAGQRGFAQFYEGGGEVSPMGFYMAKQGKPEELAASVSRLFLGVRLECAQCHDHPFGKWTREEFWSQAAFFAGMKGPRGDFFGQPITEVSDRRELTIPNTDRVAQARFLDGKQPRWKFKVGARTTLADWMTAKENPFFAKAIVNRMWAHFFGIGIVEPVDDLVEDNAPSHPELLNMLAQELVEHDFDLKFLIRAITLSRAYQLSSYYEGSPPEPRLFARMAVKGLTAEQLYDSLKVAAGIRDNTTFQQRIYSFGTSRQMFEDRFGEQEKKTEYHTSIPQALTMMNNALVTAATHPEQGEVLGAIVNAPFMNASGKIEALFLAALSRKPTATEAARFQAYVEKGKTSKEQNKALSDVYWALLNSTEFKFNH